MKIACKLYWKYTQRFIIFVAAINGCASSRMLTEFASEVKLFRVNILKTQHTEEVCKGAVQREGD